jgi:hypothetical protein
LGWDEEVKVTYPLEPSPGVVPSWDGTGLFQYHMSTTISQLKARILGFINRDKTVFNTESSGNNIDQVLAAINDARRSAQREYNFALLQGDAFLTTSEIGANWMTGCKTTPGGTVTQLMKKVDSVYNYSTSTIPAGTLYARTSKIDFGNVADFKREVPVDSGSQYLLQQTATGILLARRKFAFMNGQNLHIATVDTAVPVMLNGTTFLDDLLPSDSPDVFLTYFSDWLFWATITQLNQFIKDDARINIDGAFMGRLWQSVKEMDGQIANSGDSATLD